MKIARYLQIASLILLAAGAQPALGAFWQWSKTAATNAGADPTINWAEGMSPSSVNDSARAMMARAAEYRDDISGTLALGGTSTAYTVTTNQGLTATPPTGVMLAFTPNTTNGIAPTLVADGGTAFPLQLTAGTAIPAGTIVAGTPYRASFNGTAWVLEAGYGNPYAVPLGGMLPSTVSSPPNSNFVIPAGQCLSTTTYNAYWLALGSPASGSCAGGQFKLIDMRGRVPAGLDNLGGVAANLMTNSSAGCGVAFTSVGVVCGAESQTLSLAQIPTITSTPNSSQSVSVFARLSSFNLAAGVTNVMDLLITSGGGGTTSQNYPVNGVNYTSSGTSGQAHPNVQPTAGVYYFVRVI